MSFKYCACLIICAMKNDRVAMTKAAKNCSGQKRQIMKPIIAEKRAI